MTGLLANELRNRGLQYVAIKIISSKASQAFNEVVITRSIEANEAARDHVVTLLDHFKCVGPNGEHDCLVFEPMGPSVVALFGRSIPYREGRSMSRQLLTALQCLHNLRLAHVDTHPGNLLVSLTRPIEGLSEGGKSMSTQSNGKRNPCAPRHIHQGRPLTEFWDDKAPTKLKLSDFGVGTY